MCVMSYLLLAINGLHMCVMSYLLLAINGLHMCVMSYLLLAINPEEVGTDHVSDHALRFSSDVSMERMYRLSFCRNCETLHPGVGLNGKSS